FCLPTKLASSAPVRMSSTGFASADTTTSGCTALCNDPDIMASPIAFAIRKRRATMRAFSIVPYSSCSTSCGNGASSTGPDVVLCSGMAALVDIRSSEFVIVNDAFRIGPRSSQSGPPEPQNFLGHSLLCDFNMLVDIAVDNRD